MADTIFLLVIFLTSLSRLRRNVSIFANGGMLAPNLNSERDSFNSKVLLSMEIVALAARPPEC
jgi:hypothetical protein